VRHKDRESFNFTGRKIMATLCFDRDDIVISPVFDSDNELADDDGNVYVVELGDDIYLTYGKA
jgi:hypothetical protein